MMSKAVQRRVRNSDKCAAPIYLAMVVVALAASTVALVSRKNARTAEDHFQAFIIHLQDQRYEEARRDIDVALSGSPDNAYYRSNQGLIYERLLSRSNGATELFPTTIDPDSPDMPGLSRAVAAYTDAIKASPNDGCFHHNLGRLYWRMGRYDLAFDSLRKAVAVDPENGAYHVSLGMLYELSGAADEAASEYRSALRVSPAILDSPFFHDLDARDAALAQKAKSGAIADLEARIAESLDPIAEAELGKLYLGANGAGDVRARDLLIRATSELPSLSRGWLNLGICFDSEGDADKAELCYRRAAFLDASDYLPSTVLGALAEKRNDRQGAIDYYRKAVENWDRLMSEHAYRSARTYNTRYVVRDDIVPFGFLAYTSPSFDRSQVYLKISSLAAQSETPARAADSNDESWKNAGSMIMRR